MPAVIMTFEYYQLPPSMRRTVAAALWKVRRDAALTPPEWTLFCFWLLRAFRRDTLAVALWTETGWPVVRDGSGCWRTLNLRTKRVLPITIRRNLDTGVDYRKMA